MDDKAFSEVLDKPNCMFWIRNSEFRDELVKRAVAAGISTEGKPVTELVYMLKSGLKGRPKCAKEGCSNEVKRASFGYRKFCSSKCSASSSSTREKCSRTCQEKYGSSNVFGSKEIKDKIRKNSLEKHGVEHWTQTVHGKVVLTSSERRKLPTVYRRMAEKLKEEVVPLFSEEEFSGCSYEREYSWRCIRCGKEFLSWYKNGTVKECPHCRPAGNEMEREVFQFLTETLQAETKERTRTVIPPMELDFWIQSERLGIELDGLFWHGESRGTQRDYHLRKTLAAEKAGANVIHVFEDEWLFKKKATKDRLRSKVGRCRFSVGARKLEIREIPPGAKHDFVEKHHLQGDCGSAVNLGAFLRGKLCAAMTFGKRRRMLGSKGCPSTEWELLRFCTVGNFSFPGLASRMLRRFETTHSWRKITSYCDRRWNDGHGYFKMGFVLDHVSPPCYWYVRERKRFHRAGFMKHMLPQRLERFDPAKTEWENMQDNGWDRIWDCGNLVFVKVNF